MNYDELKRIKFKTHNSHAFFQHLDPRARFHYLQHNYNAIVFECYGSWRTPMRDAMARPWTLKFFKCVIDRSIERSTITHRNNITLFTRCAVILLHFVAGEIGIGCHGNLFLRMISILTSVHISLSVLFYQCSPWYVILVSERFILTIIFHVCIMKFQCVAWELIKTKAQLFPSIV